MSELSNSLRKMADWLDTAPGHTAHLSAGFDKLLLFVQNDEQLDSMRPLLDQIAPKFDTLWTEFVYVAGPLSLEIHVKTDLIAEKAEVGTAPVYGYKLKSSAA